MGMQPMEHPTFFVPLGIVGFILLIVSLYWVYNDAERRGKHPLLVSVLVLLVNWPFSFLLWYFFRPDEQTSGDSDSFE